jgi:hypothetical protein
MSQCRWCSQAREHLKDCPLKNEPLRTVVNKVDEGFTDETDGTVYKG